MAKDKITDLSETAADNTDIAGVGIVGNTNNISNLDNAIRAFGSMVAKVDRGTDPVRDTWTFADPADLTKRFRFDGGSITAGNTRVVTMPDADVTVPSGTIATTTATQTFTNKVLSDSTTAFADDGDATKLLKFQCSGITTGTTRTVTWPDASGTVMLAGQYPTIVSLEGLTLAAGTTLYATAADTLAALAKGTALQVLRMNAGATAPEWATLDVAASVAALAYGAVGTYVFGFKSAVIAEDTTYAGSGIEPAGFTRGASTIADDATTAIDLTKGGSALSGTWRAMGRANVSGNNQATLFLRIS